MSKYLLLTSNAYWPSIGGIENSLRHLALEASKDGYRTLIVAGDIGVPESEPNRLSVVVEGTEVRRYPVRPLDMPLLSPFNILVAHWRLFQLFRAIKPPIDDCTVVARFHFCAMVAIWAGFKDVRYLVPSVVANQSGMEGEVGDARLVRLRRSLHIRLHNLVQRYALKKCTNFVFSETMRAQCSRLAGNDPTSYRLVKPGVDGARFHAVPDSNREDLRLALNLPPKVPLILFVGRFVKAKGVDLLLEASAALPRECHLLLIGSGEELENYESIVSRLNLRERVTIMSPKKNVEDYYRCADLFVMSSSYEPLGQTLLEALASGLLVAAFKRGKSVDTATEELGMDDFVEYAEEHTASALAEVIKKQLSRLPSHDRNKVSALALSKFNWSKLLRDLVST